MMSPPVTSTTDGSERPVAPRRGGVINSVGGGDGTDSPYKRRGEPRLLFLPVVMLRPPVLEVP